jgi:ABC-type sugar transport system ATPase subunit
MHQELLRFVDITKSYGGVNVLNHINMNVLKGETVVLMGENGAGKSTLVKILCGMLQKDSGKIYLNEEAVEITSPLEARKMGIHSIVQDPDVAPNLTVAQNIFLYSSYQTSKLRYQNKTVRNYASELLETLNIRIDPDAYAGDLTMSQKYLLLTAMTVCTESRLIIMDEATAAMDATDREIVFRIIEKYKRKGNSVIFVTQDVEEALSIADRIIMIRNGANAGTVRKKDFFAQKIIKLMAGRDPAGDFNYIGRDPGREILRMEKASIGRNVRDVTISVREGEIVGVAGLVGSGKTLIGKAAFGLVPLDDGAIFVCGKRQHAYSANRAIKQKIAYIPEERIRMGVFSNMNVEDNITVSIAEKISSAGFIKQNMRRYVSTEYIERFDIATKSPKQNITALSGGNQQKVILSRLLALNPILVIADEPTNGLDIATKAQVRRTFFEMARKGVGILCIASNVQEILQICDKVVILSNGRVKRTLSRNEALNADCLAEELY